MEDLKIEKVVDSDVKQQIENNQSEEYLEELEITRKMHEIEISKVISDRKLCFVFVPEVGKAINFNLLREEYGTDFEWLKNNNNHHILTERIISGLNFDVEIVKELKLKICTEELVYYKNYGYDLCIVYYSFSDKPTNDQIEKYVGCGFNYFASNFCKHNEIYGRAIIYDKNKDLFAEDFGLLIDYANNQVYNDISFVWKNSALPKTIEERGKVAECYIAHLLKYNMIYPSEVADLRLNMYKTYVVGGKKYEREKPTRINYGGKGPIKLSISLGVN